jgi:hypothetical protein
MWADDKAIWAEDAARWADDDSAARRPASG